MRVMSTDTDAKGDVGPKEGRPPPSEDTVTSRDVAGSPSPSRAGQMPPRWATELLKKDGWLAKTAKTRVTVPARSHRSQQG